MASQASLLTRLTVRTGETDRELLDELLAEATDIYMDHRFPHGDRPAEVEDRYAGLVLLMAIDLYYKIGAEGQMSHSENGISRTYSSGWVSKDLVSQIVPYCGVVS